MSSLRMRVMRTGVLGGALACALVFAMPGGAVTSGTAVTPAPSWTAYVVGSHPIPHSHKRTISVCSGAVVASRWILTAAQCVAPTAPRGCKFLRPYRPRDFTVYLGRTSSKNKGQAYKITAFSLHGNRSIRADGQCVLKNDVALLHLSKATASVPLWIAPSPAAVTNGTQAVLYGYGRTNAKKATTVGSLRRTKTGDWKFDTTCDLASSVSATCMDSQRLGASAGSTGDNGGPWTMTVDGSFIESAVFSGFVKSKGFAYGTGVTQTSTGAWLHTKLGIPVVAPGNIVHDPIGGNSWLIDPQGYRRPIADGVTLACLTGSGDPVVDLAAGAIQMMAARTVTATCGREGNVLIAGVGDFLDTEPNDNLYALFTSAGYTVTESTTLPADLSTFGQVWWLDTAAPSPTEQAQLLAFEGAGGGVFLTGERPCCEDLNTADTTMINSMVGVGGVTAGRQGNVCICTSADAVNQNVVGNLAQQPFALDHWTPSQPGGMLGVTGSSVFSYYQPGDISTRVVVAAAWDRPSLIGNGRLVVLMDINWSEAGYRGSNWADLAQNMAFFLSGLSAPPSTPVTPAAAIFESPLLGVPWMRGSTIAP